MTLCLMWFARFGPWESGLLWYNHVMLCCLAKNDAGIKIKCCCYIIWACLSHYSLTCFFLYFFKKFNTDTSITPKVFSFTSSYILESEFGPAINLLNQFPHSLLWIKYIWVLKIGALLPPPGNPLYSNGFVYNSDIVRNWFCYNSSCSNLTLLIFRLLFINNLQIRC